MLSSPTEFHGISFTLSDGSTEFVAPHPEVKAEVERILNPTPELDVIDAPFSSKFSPGPHFTIDATFSTKLLDELTAEYPAWQSATFAPNGKFSQIISRTFYEDCKRLDEETRPILEKMVYPFTLEEYSDLIREKDANT